MPRISSDRAIARLRAIDHVLRRPRAKLPLAALLSTENVEAVATLDLYSQYDEDIAERERRQRLLLAWLQDRPTGTLQ
jgi:hypothetical protein